MAHDLCGGKDPVTRAYHQDQMRNHLLACFERKQHSLKKFPGRNRTFDRRVLDEIVFDLYCLCRQPEMSKTMACCDLCNEWYHEGCMPIPEDVFADTDNSVASEWLCCQCKRMSLTGHKLSLLL